ncbi:protein-glutamate O-methyltransferase [Terrihabitans soli]|uniref:protein-glutamate O-methyltransferase n=1 Tax=Terrihabitans soli TaxID=708113 RepID=A0A6S6QNY2_9HYPH|nr:CheR family methyltransferase [Terrihabitans soli]BCJ92244.1 protein-glutamate O-methyltransferase [Terrihabitans soli]
MSADISRADLERFRAAIARRTGLFHDDAKFGFLADLLQRRVHKRGASRQDYLSNLETAPADQEIAELARELTVGETYFFRNKEQLGALADALIVPRLSDGGPKTLRLLSAGCASGEEAYSLAILARETIREPGWNIRIDAVDINPAALARAKRASYSRWALRDTPEDIRARWFRANGNEMALDRSIRDGVHFFAGNLASEEMELWGPNRYDAIFCRNVLMYFEPAQMRGVVVRMAQALVPRGLLFLGHAETLRGVSDDFHLLHTHGAFYYRRKSANEMSSVTTRDGGSEQALSDDWADIIGKATDRVTALLIEKSKAPEDSIPILWDKAPALDLMGRERFGEALDYVQASPPPIERDADMLLLEATLLVHSGRVKEAEELCRKLLLLDEFNAGAHYLLALCCEQDGKRESARDHDRVAAYLDASFAMPRLHLGLLAVKSGDRDGARRELACAMMLLEHEEASRILMFGGGFNRRALMDLCRNAMLGSGANA